MGIELVKFTPNLSSGVVSGSPSGFQPKFDADGTYQPAIGNFVLFIGGLGAYSDPAVPPDGWTGFNFGSVDGSILCKIWEATDSTTTYLSSTGDTYAQNIFVAYEFSGVDPINPLETWVDISSPTGTSSIADQYGSFIFAVSPVTLNNPPLPVADIGCAAIVVFVRPQNVPIVWPLSPSTGTNGLVYDGAAYDTSGTVQSIVLTFSVLDIPTGTFEPTVTISSDFDSTGFYDFLTMALKPAPTLPSIPLVPPAPQGISQARSFLAQVYRNGNWVNIPIKSASGDIQKGQAGQLTLKISDNKKDKYRSQLFEGEKVRAYRGIVGQPGIRSWTGYVDAPTATDAGEISRTAIVTDILQELNSSVLLAGIVYDNWDPTAACADAIQQAINTQQYRPTDDSGNYLTSTASFNLPAGNNVCYFPALFNADGTPFVMASGQLGSFTSGPFAYASLMVPTLSTGANYIAYTLPNQYLIASMTKILSFGLATTTTLPPPSGQASIDYFNGIFYFNAADAGKTLYVSSTYFQSPLWAFSPGTRVSDILSEIMDKSGCRYGADAYGKVWAKYIDATAAPVRILNRSEYIDMSIQTNRDRRNVIICEGWNTAASQLIVSKGVNFTDINNPPPVGLGKRQYMIVQDHSWGNQDTTNAAAYFALNQIGRRGKVMSVEMVDDPTIGVEDVIGFNGCLPETGPGDFFYVDSLAWSYEASTDGMKSRSTVTGGMLPGQGLFFVGPVNTTTSVGALDFSFDATPLSACSLTPTGGKFSSAFSLSSAGGLHLNYTAAISYHYFYDAFHDFVRVANSAVSSVTIFGSDGSQHGPYNLTGAYVLGGTHSYSVPLTGMMPGVLYVIKFIYTLNDGSSGYYRDFITSLP